MDGVKYFDGLIKTYIDADEAVLLKCVQEFAEAIGNKFGTSRDVYIDMLAAVVNVAKLRNITVPLDNCYALDAANLRIDYYKTLAEDVEHQALIEKSDELSQEEIEKLRYEHWFEFEEYLSMQKGWMNGVTANIPFVLGAADKMHQIEDRIERAGLDPQTILSLPEQMKIYEEEMCKSKT